MRLVFRTTFYVRISPERLDVRNIGSGESISEIPEIAIRSGPRPTIVGIGDGARAAAAEPGVSIVNPFAHPRSIVSDVTLGQALLKAFLRQLDRGFLRIAPVIVIHPLGTPEGGFTEVENRALREMASGAGASKVVLWQGRVLTDEELRAGSLPSSGSSGSES